MILYDQLPGQEEGNVALVEGGGAGVWAPEPEAIVGVLRTWLEDPDALARARESCRSLARPEAAHDIARLIVFRCMEDGEEKLGFRLSAQSKDVRFSPR